MDDLSYEYPDELKSGGRTAMQELSFQTWRGAKKRIQMQFLSSYCLSKT